MACDDRQLTQAQRAAAFQQQGAVQAIRPFSGSPTVPNLIDYINRELFPAIKATRSRVNDVFDRVRDNAPSGNPLQFYFSTETGAADPTTGRVRLNQASQETATVLRVSETNGRLQDVVPWLDVMAGGATTPLGTITLSDVINPARFLRFDLNTMTDQGDYWDLGITIIESSHENPFVDDGGVVIAFTPGVAAAGATVPPSGLSPIATDTFLANISGSTAAPSAVPLASVDSTSITYDGTAHEFRRAALTGFAEATANSNATTSAEPLVTYTASSNMTAERVATSSTSVTVTGGSGLIEWRRAALTGFAEAGVNSNATTSAEPIVTFSASSNMSNERVLSNGTGTTIDIGTAGQVQVDIDTPLTDGDKGDITVSSNGSVFTIDNDVVTNAKLANVTSPSLKGRTTASTGDPEDLTLAASTSITWNTATGGSISLERAALTGDVTASANSNATTIADDAVSNAKLANMAAARVKGVQVDGATGDPQDLTGLEVGELLRLGTTQAATLAATTNDLSLNADATVLHLTSTTGAQTLTGITGGVQGRLLFVENVSADGNPITLTSLDAGSLTANRIRTARAVSLVLGFRESALLRWETNNGDWRVVAAARATAVADADYGDITVSANGLTWTIDNNAVSDAKLANMAQSTIKGRAESAGTGVPQALTPTQVVAIIDGESPTWTGAHTFNGGSLTANVTTADVLLGAIDGGVGLFSGRSTSNVTNGDLVLNSAGGIGIHATGSSITSVPDGTIDIEGTTLDVDMTGNVTIDTPGNITIASSSTGATTVTGGSSGLILTASSTIGLNSPTVANQIVRFDAILTSTLAGNVDDLDVSNYNVVRLNPNAGARRLRGMAAGGDGQLVLLLNTSTTNSFNIIDESDTVDGSSSAAANRFRLPSTTTQVLGTNGAVWMWYDGTTDRWRMR